MTPVLIQFLDGSNRKSRRYSNYVGIKQCLFNQLHKKAPKIRGFFVLYADLDLGEL